VDEPDQPLQDGEDALAGMNRPRPQHRRNELAGVPIEDHERMQHALVVVAVAGHPFLLAVGRIIGPIEVEDDAKQVVLNSAGQLNPEYDATALKRGNAAKDGRRPLSRHHLQVLRSVLEAERAEGRRPPWSALARQWKRDHLDDTHYVNDFDGRLFRQDFIWTRERVMHPTYAWSDDFLGFRDVVSNE